MVCEDCGICCNKGFFNLQKVYEGILKLDNKKEIINYLKNKDIKNNSNKSLLNILKFYHISGNESYSPCVFLNEKKECEIHPFKIKKDLRGIICQIPSCKKSYTNLKK